MSHDSGHRDGALHILNFGVEDVAAHADLRDLVAQFRRQGSITVLSHPIKIERGIPPGIEELLDGVEVWNSRYDGKGTPRSANLELWSRLSAHRPGLAAFSGLDFHSTSDYAPIWIEVDSPSRTERAVLDALRSGPVRIVRRGRIVSLDRGGPVERFRRALYTSAYDEAYRAHSFLHQLGLQPPAWVRRTLKRIF